MVDHFADIENEVHDYGVSVEYLNVQFNDNGLYDNGTSTLDLRFLTMCCMITLEVNFFPQLIVEAGCEEELQHHHTQNGSSTINPGSSCTQFLFQTVTRTA